MLRTLVPGLALFLAAALTLAQPPQVLGLEAGSSRPQPEIDRLTLQGDRHFNAGRYAEALQDYQKALLRAQESRLVREQAELINNMAAVFMARGDQENFPRYFAQARQLKADLEEGRAAAVVRPATGNLLVNGGFEAGLVYPWGTGHYETSRGKTRFGIWWNSMNARAFMKIDTDQRHSGRQSLRITNYSPAASHVFTTTSQRLSGLAPNTLYRVTLYARAENLTGGAFFTVDAAWTKHLLGLPKGTYDWTRFSETVNIGHNDYIDLRFILGSPGTVWIDDLVVELEKEPTGVQAALQKAESLYDRARFQEALALYQELERTYPQDKGLLLQVRHQAGRIHLALGRYEEARGLFRWLDQNGSRPAPIALGDLYYQLGEFDRANLQYNRALELYQGDQGTYSRILEKLAASLLAQGKLDQAFEAQRRSLHIQTHIGDLHGQALALNTTGLLYLLKQDYGQALTPLATAVRLARQVNDPRLLAAALINQGEVRLRQGRLPEARGPVEEGLRLSRSIGDPRTRLQGLYLRGRLQRQAGDLTQALADFREAVAQLQELYSHLGVTPRETRQTFLGQFSQLYRDYIDLLLEMYEKTNRSDLREEAFQRSEEARARIFTEMVNEVRAAQAFAATTQDPLLGRLLHQEREAGLALEAVRLQQARLLGGPPSQRQPALQAALDQELARALEKFQQAQQEVRAKFPRYADLKNPQPLGFQEIQGLLQPDEAVLSYFVTARRTAVWALNREQVELAVLPLGRQALRERTRSLTEALPALAESLAELAQAADLQRAGRQLQAKFLAFDLNAAYSLYQTLVAPVEKVLAGKRLTFLAPDDLLYQLPFEALLAEPPPPAAAGSGKGSFQDAAFWVRTQSLSYLPSVSVLRSLRSLGKGAPPSQKALLAFADPIFENGLGGPAPAVASRRSRLQMLRNSGALRAGSLPRLPETAEEAHRAARALGGRADDLYLQERATEKNLRALPLADFSVLLFATHGLMAGEFRPGVQPALALSFVGDPDHDGLLEMGEILGLDLKARLVVLSACNTGRAPPEDRGEGFAGLTRSFMYAGGESLVVTLWSVESQSAVQLMGDFYGALKHKDRAVALADAKRAMIAAGGSLKLDEKLELSLAHPFFWAPYVMVGEGR